MFITWPLHVYGMQTTDLQQMMTTARRQRSSITSDTELNYNLRILAKREGRSMTEEARHITEQTMKKLGLSYKHFTHGNGGSA